MRHAPSFWPRSGWAFRSYVRKTLQNKIREAIREARQKPPVQPLDPEMPHPAPSPHEEAVGREAFHRYETAFHRLGGRDRELIHLRFEMHFSFREIASFTGKRSDDAARMAVTRALTKLVKEMGRVR